MSGATVGFIQAALPTDLHRDVDTADAEGSSCHSPDGRCGLALAHDSQHHHGDDGDEPGDGGQPAQQMGFGW